MALPGHAGRGGFAHVGDEHAFYRSSEAYLYNLTAFAMTGTKLPYLQTLVAASRRAPACSTTAAASAATACCCSRLGFEVEFADFANPSTEYLRWRLPSAASSAPIHDLAEPSRRASTRRTRST